MNAINFQLFFYYRLQKSIIKQQQPYNKNFSLFALRNLMNVVNRAILNILSKHIQNSKKYGSSHQVCLDMQEKLKMICKFTDLKSKFYFSSVGANKNSQAKGNEEVEVPISNLQTYIKNPKTIEILQKKGIKTLFPIQLQTFEAVYQGRDILASDRTGSGKTIAYSLPILQKFRDQNVFRSGKKQVKFLIMCPTRQLSLQVFREIATLKHSSSDFNAVALYGGAPIDQQIRQLRNGVDVVVATPGRLMDLLQRKCINFTQLQATCIDEADQMLEKGFKLDIQQIFRIIKSQRQQKTQNLMFSATIPDWVDKISKDILDKNKKKINLINKNQAQTSTTVQHLAVQCRYHDRLNCIKSVIKMYNSSESLSTIIFAQTKLEVTDLAMEFGKDSAFLQGDMSQKERQYNLAAFRSGKRKILIATDVASRGLDIDNVGLVIQLEPPRNTQPFIHRAGRTGRAGKKGICITFFDRRKNLLDMIRVQNQAKITFAHIPKPHFEQSVQIWERKLSKIPHQIKQIKQNDMKNQRVQLIAETLLSSHTDVKQLIIRHLLLLAGQAPVNKSLTSEQAGLKTFLLQMKDQQSQINTLTALNFIKNSLVKLGVTNVHVQSANIIFDIPQDKVQHCKQLISSQQVQQSVYRIKEASFKDRQMIPLRQLGRGKGRQSSSFQNRGQSRNLDRNSRGRQSTYEGQELNVFIPNLPFQVQNQQIEEQLNDMGIQFQRLRLKKKSQTNVFAFVTIKDPQSFKFLIKAGISINGSKIRVKAAQNRQTQSSGNSERRFGGSQFRKSQGRGYDRQNTGDRNGRDNNRVEKNMFQDKRSSRNFNNY